MPKIQFRILLALIFLLPCVGCQFGGQGHVPAQPFGQFSQSQVAAPGFEQTFPPGSAPFQQQVTPFGQRAGQFMGSLATGFLRSTVGGAGFTAGRDLWNEIVR